MNSGYGCPGEWRCLKAAALGEGNYEEKSDVIAFITCECPGRTVIPNLGMAMKLSQIKPDVIHLSTCLAKSRPGCPYTGAEDLARLIEEKTGIRVILGTHDYH